MNLSIAAEITGSGCLVLLLIVLIKNERQLLRACAHGVGTVNSSGGVLSDTITDGAVQTTDVIEEISTRITRNTTVGNTGQRLNHTFAEICVCDRGKVASCGPSGTGCWACLCNCVGNSVGGRVGGARSGRGQLLRKSSEIWELADSVS